ncbi:hypothetical protein PaeCFBP13512_03855 [Paenibacillus sp. CFBP13512]|uniref:DUF262 domain-containing protein n=1 Tax=Paenibacillus sp. CFBP13512 TaxID=2184007 RepID=UPI0010C154F1|nr:DUF262 domain-containing protein [Paenibacillus sp. CFBP13512]TKJ93531.1 hypothetical protein PaeCFBP13512_03855 [Paenibacillus sp. CFBP13512]
MNFHATQQTLETVLSATRKYIVPRFQREYSWTVDELGELWKDIIINIKYENNEFNATDYFIGSLVLVGTQDAQTLEIIDGQQRLTSITIFLSALVHYCDSIQEEKLANGCHHYIEGLTVDSDKFFRLENTRSSNFIKQVIQNRNPIVVEANTTEEKNLLDAYNFFLKKLRTKQLIIDINNYTGSKKENKKDDELECIKAIRNQVLAFKTIYITEPNEEEAYTIFETLNAKGLDLSMADLIKNQIFKVLRDTHPVDSARNKWDIITKNLYERENQVDIKVFMRHFWISKYEHVAEAKVYRSFTTNVKGTKRETKEFLDSLVTSSSYYKMISSPHSEDWKDRDVKAIYQSLQALNSMRIISPRPLILALFEAHSTKKLSHIYLKKALKALEDFHFTFSAVCSLSASGLESKYSRFARELRRAESKKDKHDLVDSLVNELYEKRPDFTEFSTQFSNKLIFSEEHTKEKKTIQYFFKRLELYLIKNNEIDILNMSLEHITPQSKASDVEYTIGNLIPLDPDLNSKCGSKDFKIKLDHYKNSNFLSVKKFIEEVGDKQVWDKADINHRTDQLAKLAFEEIFTVK